MGSKKETLTKKIGALCVVAVCSQFMEHNRKHSIVSNTRKGKCWDCVKSVQIRNFFWSVFSCIQSEYKKIRAIKNSIFRHFSRSVGKTAAG